MTQELVLADGTVINTATGEADNGVPGYVVVPTYSEAVEKETKVRRKLSDLPDLPEKMNVITLVAAYDMFGLEDYEIASAMGITQRQVQKIKMSDQYVQMQDAFADARREADETHVRNVVQANAIKAADTMANALTSPNEQSRIVAAKDILDRAGHRPADVVEHRHKVEGGLRIEYIVKDDSDDIPTIDLNAKDVTDG